jgi:hypothetical protein
MELRPEFGSPVQTGQEEEAKFDEMSGSLPRMTAAEGREAAIRLPNKQSANQQTRFLTTSPQALTRFLTMQGAA